VKGKKEGVKASALVLQNTHVERNVALPQGLDPFATDKRAGIFCSDDYLSDSFLDDPFGTRGCFSVMTAGL